MLDGRVFIGSLCLLTSIALVGCTRTPGESRLRKHSPCP